MGRGERPVGADRRVGCLWALGVLAALVVGIAGAGLLATWALVSSVRASGPRDAGCLQSERDEVQAAAKGDVDAVRAWLEGGGDPDRVDDSGNSLLACAGPEGHLAVVEVLLEAGADPDTVARDGDRVLADAARFCRPSVASALLAAGADPEGLDRDGVPALEQAARHGDIDTTLALLDGAADVGAFGVLRPGGAEPVLGAAERGPACREGLLPLHESTLNVLLGAGADPQRVLDRAVVVGATETVRRALDAGADPDVGLEGRAGELSWLCGVVSVESLEAGTPAEYPDLCAGRPLSALAGRAGVAVVDDPTLPDGWAQRPPLLVAAWRGDEATVELLLAAGADPNAAAGGGFTALHAAAAAGDADIELRLLTAGAVVPPGSPPLDDVRPVVSG